MELKVKISMLSNGGITKANCKEFSEKALKGFTVKVKEPTMEPFVWDEDPDMGFMPKSKTNRAWRVESKKKLDHKESKRKKLWKELNDKYGSSAECWMSAQTAINNLYYIPYYPERDKRAMTRHLPETRIPTRAKLLSDYHESVAEEEAVMEAMGRMKDKTNAAIKEAIVAHTQAEDDAARAERAATFYHAKAATELWRIAELEEKLAMLEGFVN